MSITAVIPRDVIESLENPTLPAPETSDANPPPTTEAVMTSAALSTDEGAMIVAGSVTSSEGEGIVPEKTALKDAFEAGASFTQELVLAPLLKSGASEALGSQKVEVFESHLVELPPEFEIQGLIAGVQVCL